MIVDQIIYEKLSIEVLGAVDCNKYIIVVWKSKEWEWGHNPEEKSTILAPKSCGFRLEIEVETTRDSYLLRVYFALFLGAVNLSKHRLFTHLIFDRPILVTL